MSQIETAKEQLVLANRLVDEFAASVTNGEPMDLQEFNSTIDHACKVAVTLPQEHLQEIKAELVALLDRLNAAKEDLEQARATATAESSEDSTQ